MSQLTNQPSSAACDEHWMRKALKLGFLSLGMTWPNPGVGCVIVKDGRIIGKGRHIQCGKEHAEVNALKDVQQKGHDPRGAEVYVTLSPCTKHGRQPPCLNALLEAKVKRVIVAVNDSSQGSVEDILRQSGILYSCGVGEEEARQLHGGFLMRVQNGRPRFTGKWALSLDGFFAAKDKERTAISSPQAFLLSRRRRRLFDGILIGSGTLQYDDPLLTASVPRVHSAQMGPVRIVLTSSLKGLKKSLLMSSLSKAPLLIISSSQDEEEINVLLAMGVQFLRVLDVHDLLEVASELGKIGFNEVLVEGGRKIHGAFLQAGLYDRLELYQGPRILGNGLTLLEDSNKNASSRYLLEHPPFSRAGTVISRYKNQDYAI